MAHATATVNVSAEVVQLTLTDTASVVRFTLTPDQARQLADQLTLGAFAVRTYVDAPMQARKDFLQYRDAGGRVPFADWWARYGAEYR